MKVVDKRGLFLLPFVLLYLILSIVDIVYVINAIYINLFGVLLWALFLTFVIKRLFSIQKKNRVLTDYLIVLLFLSTLLLNLLNVIRRY